MSVRVDEFSAYFVEEFVDERNLEEESLWIQLHLENQHEGQRLKCALYDSDTEEGVEWSYTFEDWFRAIDSLNSHEEMFKTEYPEADVEVPDVEIYGLNGYGGNPAAKSPRPDPEAR